MLNGRTMRTVFAPSGAVFRAGLPMGRPLPAADWLRRHRAILVILWLHVVAFVALDVVRRQAARVAGAFAAAATVAALALGSRNGLAGLERGLARLVDGPRLTRNAIDRALDATWSQWPRGAPDVVLLGNDDAYLNYRLGLRQHGFVSPAFAHVRLEETAAWLHEEMTHDNRVLVPKGDAATLASLGTALQELNRTPLMRREGARFTLAPETTAPFHEVLLTRAP